MPRSVRRKVVAILLVTLGISALAWAPPLVDRLGWPAPPWLAAHRLRLGLDLRGGVQFVLRVNVHEAQAIDSTVTTAEVVARTREAIDRRINALGVVEPVIAVQGDQRDELLIQLPGFTDVERARAILGATAKLELKVVGDESAAVGGGDIRRAWVTRDDFGLPAVGFSLTTDGSRRFADLTSEHVGRQLAIVLDDEVQSAPVIEGPIMGGEGIIRGGFSFDEATDLALLLQAGALPVSLTPLGSEYVGPSLGSSSVRAGLVASLGGLAFVAVFMLVYYRRAGINAVVSVIVNLAVLAGAMASLGAALTLPGIAGLILTIGMGVDTNVLIFERIREELARGLSVRRAVAAGFDRVFLTIMDTHVTSLVAAAFLFQFGNGAIRGFATMLSLGLLTNLFTATVVSRTLFEWSLSRGRRVTIGSGGFRALTERLTFDFTARRALTLGCSAAIVVAALSVIVIRGLPLGVDFTGGTAIIAEFDRPVAEDEVRQVVPEATTVQRFGTAPERTVQLRLAQPADADAGTGDDPTSVRAVEAALEASDLPAPRVIGSSSIGPTISQDFHRKAISALIGALVGTSAYLALRFRPGFAAGAAAATCHDLVVTVAAISLAGYDLDLNVVAALLAVAGYSANDTIVIFDRVRERLKTMGQSATGAAINLAITDTLGRTIITSGTTLIAVLALYLFGGEALGGFAFTVLVGVVVGTWSSVFVAAPLAAVSSGAGPGGPRPKPAGADA